MSSDKDKEFKGYCKECGEKVYCDTQIPGRNIWECPKCGYPHSEEDLFEAKPSYIK